jgi:hypothetical protein
MVTWPVFPESAISLGLRTSLSIPLFAGSGTTVAALNLDSRHADAMTPLTAAICDAYDSGSSIRSDHDDLGAGGWDLSAGVIGALAVRCMIQRSIRFSWPSPAGSARARLPDSS